MCSPRLSPFQSIDRLGIVNIFINNLPNSLDDFQVGRGDDGKRKDEAQEVDEDDVRDGVP